MNDVAYLHKILVLSNGCLQEYNEPTSLVDNPNSHNRLSLFESVFISTN